MIGLFEFWLLVRAVRSTYFMVKIWGDTSTKRPPPRLYLDHPTVSQALSPIQAQPTCFAVAIWVLMLSGTEPSYQVGVPGSDAEPDRFHAAHTASPGGARRSLGSQVWSNTSRLRRSPGP